MPFRSTHLVMIAAIVLILVSAGCSSHPPDLALSQPVASVQPENRPAGGDSEKQIQKNNQPSASESETDKEIIELSDQLASKTPEKKRHFRTNPNRLAPKASAARTAVTKKLETVRVGTMDFQDEELSNVFKLLTVLSGVNIAVEERYSSENFTWLPSHLEKEYGDQISSSKERGDEILKSKITIYLKDVTLKEALTIICKDKDLRWEIDDDGHIRVADKNDQITISFDDQSFADLDTEEAFSEGIIRELDVSGKKLKNVLKELSGRTGVNIVCKPYLDNWSIRIHLENVTVRTAVEAICEKYYLWYTSTPAKDYICLIGNEEFASEAAVDYRVKTRVFNLQYASAPQVADSIGSVMGNRVEYVLPANLNSYEHLKMPDLETEKGKIESQKSETEITKQISIPDLKSENLSLDKIQSIIDKALDLRLTAADIRWINKEAGFAIMTIFLRNNAVLVCSTDERLLREIEALVRQLDVPTPQVLIECRVLGVTLSDDFHSFFQVSDLEYSQADGVVQPYGVDSQTLNVPTFGASGAEALYSFVNQNLKLKVKLELLQKDGRVHTIATPMIVAAQNSQAEVSSGQENVPMFSDIDVIAPTYDEDGNITTMGYTTPQYETVDLVGTMLRITPQINQDRSVTLRIDLEQSTINKDGATIKYATFDNDGNPNPSWSSDTVDTLQKNTLKTISVVPEGSTLALGGLIEEKQNLKEEKVPVLGDIPGFGFFFKEENRVKNRTEMVILLTPRVLMAPAEANRVTAEALEGTEHPVTKKGEKYMFQYDENRKKLQETK